jgi:hypothetical protein
MDMTLIGSIAITIAVLANAGFTQESVAQQDQSKLILQAFEHYEGIRASLAGDTMVDVKAHAAPLAAAAENIGGAPAKKAADNLAAAKSLDDARKHFGELSTILVPLFQKEGIPGTSAFMCSMKNQPWMQKGDKVENPYYGKSMLTCGSPLPAKGK